MNALSRSLERPISEETAAKAARVLAMLRAAEAGEGLAGLEEAAEFEGFPSLLLVEVEGPGGLEIRDWRLECQL